MPKPSLHYDILLVLHKKGVVYLNDVVSELYYENGNKKPTQEQIRKRVKKKKDEGWPGINHPGKKDKDKGKPEQGKGNKYD